MGEVIDIAPIEYIDVDTYPSDYPVFRSFNGFRNARTNATRFAKQLVNHFGHSNKNFLFVARGSSGMFMASTIGTELNNLGHECRVIYLHKDGEDNHDHSNAYVLIGENTELVFADDLISSGQTMNLLWERAQDFSGFNHRPIVCIPRYSERAIKRLSFKPKAVIGQKPK